jgi:NAD(P)H-dependent flavin oxidoreductase YrpB (nitropropane dioxygenase family)
LNRFAEAFGVSVPLLQAPIGSCSGPELAAAVSNAGGLGGFAATWLSPEEALGRVRATRSQTSAPFYANFVLHFPPRSLEVCLEEKVPVVSFSWGVSETLISRVHSSGAKAMVQVGNLSGALRALDAGADALIVQGIEAGGHVQSSAPLADLILSVRSRMNGIPLVAAGGIGDPEAARRTLDMGADAVMLGTRFVASDEARSHPEYRERIVRSQSTDSALTSLFNLEWPEALHRVLRNATLEEWEAAGCPGTGRRPGEGETVAVTADGRKIVRYSDAAPIRGMSGGIEAMALYAGTGCGAIRSVLPAGEIVREFGAALRDGD